MGGQLHSGCPPALFVEPAIIFREGFDGPPSLLGIGGWGIFIYTFCNRHYNFNRQSIHDIPPPLRDAKRVFCPVQAIPNYPFRFSGRSARTAAPACHISVLFIVSNSAFSFSR